MIPDARRSTWRTVGALSDVSYYWTRLQRELTQTLAIHRCEISSMCSGQAQLAMAAVAIRHSSPTRAMCGA